MTTTRLRSRLAGAAVVIATGAIAMATLTGPASAAVPGLQRVSVDSVSDSSSFKQVTASCPAGKQVVGAEYSIAGGVGSIVIDDLVPSATGVRAGAREDANGTGSNWTVRATAMCANPLPGYEIVRASSSSNSLNKSATAFCPSGKQAVGSGAFISGGLGEVVLNQLVPTGNRGGATAREGDNGGTANNWTVTALAICANPLPGQQYITATSPTNSAAKLQDAVCPAGTQVLSSGYSIIGGEGDVSVTGSFTSLFDRTASAVALEDDNGTLLDWTLQTRPVCANP